MGLGKLCLQSDYHLDKTINHAAISLGGTPSRKQPNYWNGTIKWINSGAITNTPAVLKETEYITDLGVAKSATKPAMFGDTVLSIIEPSSSKVATIIDNNVYFNQSVICLSSPNNKGLIFFATKILIDEIKGYATGAAQQSINKNILEESNIRIPNKSETIDLTNMFHNSIISIERKIRELKTLKELLLQKYFTNQ